MIIERTNEQLSEYFNDMYGNNIPTSIGSALVTVPITDASGTNGDYFHAGGAADPFYFKTGGVWVTWDASTAF